MSDEPWRKRPEHMADEERELWPYDSPRRDQAYIGPEDEGFDRRGWRGGSDYYGRTPDRYTGGAREFEIGAPLPEREVLGWQTSWESSPERGSRERGDQAAEADRSRSDVGDFRGRGPHGYRRSDERIREDVCERLTDDPWIDASEIEVAVADCEVTLSGSVHSRAEKRRVEEVAGRLRGVAEVHNRLRIEQPG